MVNATIKTRAPASFVNEETRASQHPSIGQHREVGHHLVRAALAGSQVQPSRTKSAWCLVLGAKHVEGTFRYTAPNNDLVLFRSRNFPDLITLGEPDVDIAAGVDPRDELDGNVAVHRWLTEPFGGLMQQHVRFPC